MEMKATRQVLLQRSGLVFFDDLSEGPELPARYDQAIELELAQLGYVPSTRAITGAGPSIVSLSTSGANS